MYFPDIPILATAISLIICWSLFAMFCSFIHETVARTKAERGRFFRDKIIQQLRDRANEINWGYLMYTHGNLDLLSQKSNAPASELSPKLLAQTFMQVVSNSALVARHMPEQSTSLESGRDMNERVLLAFKTAAHKLKYSDVVQMMQTSLQQASAQAENLSGFVQSSNAMIDKKHVLSELENNLTLWFEQFNQQCSQWYATITRKRLFYLGLVLAILLNLDSIQLFRHFLNEPNARTQVINYYQQNEVTLQKLTQSLSDTTGNTVPDTATLKKIARDINQINKSAELPIGVSTWFTDPVFNMEAASDNKGNNKVMEWIIILFLKIIGLLLTGFAASIGAPFWFDLLKKVNLKKA